MARRQSRPAPETPALIDLRVLFVAALVASPAAYRFSQGLLTVDQALTRFLMVALACTVVSTLLRAVWPMVAGPVPVPVDAGDPALSPQPE